MNFQLQRTTKGGNLFFVTDAGMHAVGDIVEGGFQITGLGAVYVDRFRRARQNCYVAAAPGWRLVDGEPLPVSDAAKAEAAKLRQARLLDMHKVIDLVVERDVAEARIRASGWRYLAERYARACRLAEQAEDVTLCESTAETLH